MLDTKENESQIPKMTISELRRPKTRRLTLAKGKTCNLTETKATPDRGTGAMPDAPEQEIDLSMLEREGATFEGGEDTVGQGEHMTNNVDPSTAWKLEMAKFFQQMRLCERFRGLPREIMLNQMKENEWTGDYNEYCNEFSDIVTNGEEMPEHDLILYFLAGLPTDVGDELTNKGKRKFSTWNEAADAIAGGRFTVKREGLGIGGEKCPRPERNNGRAHLVASGPNAIKISTSAKRNDQASGGNESRRHGSPTSGIQTHGNGNGTNEGTSRAGRDEVDQTGQEEYLIPPWLWTEECTAGQQPYGTLCRVCSGGKTAVLRLEILGYQCEGLLDTGASRSFIQPTIVKKLGLRTRALTEEYSFTVANGEVIRIYTEVPRLTIICGRECFTGNFLVGQVPYAVILGIDWLDKESDRLRTYVNGRMRSLPVLRKEGERPDGTTRKRETLKTETDCAYEALADQISQMTAEEAAVFLRPTPKRYKAKTRRKGGIKIKELINRARKSTEEMKGATEGLNCIIMLPETGVVLDKHKPIGGQGRLMCTILECSADTTDRKRNDNRLRDNDKLEDTEESPWPNARLEFTEFDKWIESEEARNLPTPVAHLLRQYRLLFPDSLPND
ncbi:uncharacterized protein EMH_0014930 [Eimeria mitis]|uniref:Uncharacterized protein n=1 Tax=Eimeria mitis TaxID=44415 RepID=U6K5K4_9EIME|nr:uncharacterized protein EMH_0014930 [Eimeria mitis]CDJ33140.1 hypothetical protein EMH_0014930 [Eimeria mitis]